MASSVQGTPGLDVKLLTNIGYADLMNPTGQAKLVAIFDIRGTHATIVRLLGSTGRAIETVPTSSLDLPGAFSDIPASYCPRAPVPYRTTPPPMCPDYYPRGSNPVVRLALWSHLGRQPIVTVSKRNAMEATIVSSLAQIDRTRGSSISLLPRGTKVSNPWWCPCCVCSPPNPANPPPLPPPPEL